MYEDCIHKYILEWIAKWRTCRISLGIIENCEGQNKIVRL